MLLICILRENISDFGKGKTGSEFHGGNFSLLKSVLSSWTYLMIIVFIESSQKNAVKCGWLYRQWQHRILHPEFLGGVGIYFFACF